MENTVQFNNYDITNTLPRVCENNSVQLRKTKFRKNTKINNFILVSPITCTLNSEVWYCNDDKGARFVMKITSRRYDDSVFEMITEIKCDNLVPIEAYGTKGALQYEVYRYYKNGHLENPVELETIRNIILPGIINALDAIHQCGIIHNDIKPANLYWDDNMQKVLLGDFGSALLSKQRPNSFTPAYAAPELLLNDVCRRASDWCSVGLTLATLLTGKRIVNADSVQMARKIWEKGIRFECDDYNFQRLINGMLFIEPRKRFGPIIAKKWCDNTSFGSEERKTTLHKEKDQDILTITFNNPDGIAADIEGLIKEIASHWDYSLFLFQQSKMDRFLSQFDRRWVDRCRELRKMPNSEDALFRLTFELTDYQSFVWRGVEYNSLLEMEDIWEKNEIGAGDIITFLQRGNVSSILIISGAVKEKIEFVKRLENVSRVHPFEACAQLFQALRGDDGLIWGDFLLKDLNDIVEWLKQNENHLDETIDEFFKSKKFEAWFAYQGMDDVLEDIRRKCDK